MKYTQSKKILEKIKATENVVLLCHESPDIDSVVSCLILKDVLEGMGKKADIISVDDVGARIKFLKLNGNVKIVDPNKHDYSKYQAMFVLDAGDLERLGITSKVNFKGTVINIDHHEGDGVGEIRIIDRNAGSTCTLLYHIFKDWGVELDKETLDKVLLGIVADTEVFHFSIYSSSFIFRTVSELLDSGADYDMALYYADQYFDVMVFKFWAEAIKRIKIDKKNKFAYSIIPYNIYRKYIKYGISSRQLSDKFLRKIDGTNFGVVIIETEDGAAKVSIRTRTPGFFVLDLVKRLGGGGHLTGGGAVVNAGSFKETCDLILEESGKYAKEPRMSMTTISGHAS
jgi:bifunctional oligoribonuclease and PAP phosphatase NrnA